MDSIQVVMLGELGWYSLDGLDPAGDAGRTGVVRQEVRDKHEEREGVVRSAETVEHQAVVLFRDHRDVWVVADKQDAYDGMRIPRTYMYLETTKIASRSAHFNLL